MHQYDRRAFHFLNGKSKGLVTDYWVFVVGMGDRDMIVASAYADVEVGTGVGYVDVADDDEDIQPADISGNSFAEETTDIGEEDGGRGGSDGVEEGTFHKLMMKLRS